MKLETITIRFEEKIKTKEFQNINPSIAGNFSIDSEQDEAAQLKATISQMGGLFELVKETALIAAGGRKVVSKSRRHEIETWEFDDD